MADQKLTQLTAISQANVDDTVLLYCVDVDGGNVSRKVTKGNLFAGTKLTQLNITLPSAPVGSSSEFVGAIGIAANTVGFITTHQTGDYVSVREDIATLTNPSSGTIPNATTLKIIGAPVASTNVTITTARSLWVVAGLSEFDGAVTINNTFTIADSSDTTKQVLWSMSGMTTAKTATMTYANTLSRTYTFPDNSITLGPTVIGIQNIPVPAVAMWVTTTNGATAIAKTETSTNKVNYQQISFAHGATNQVEFELPMPTNWDQGTVKVVFVYQLASSTGNVVWSASCLAIRAGDALDQAMGTAQSVTDTAQAAADLSVTSKTASITPGGTVGAGCTLHFRISRLGSNGSDTATAAALLQSVRVEYTINAAVAT